MGCGGSTTSVETFNNPVENRSYVRKPAVNGQQNGSANQDAGRSSAKSRGSSANSRQSSASKTSKISANERPKSSSSSDRDQSNDVNHTAASKKTSAGSQRSNGSARQKSSTSNNDQHISAVTQFDNNDPGIDESKDGNRDDEKDTQVEQVTDNNVIANANESNVTGQENIAQNQQLINNTNVDEKHEARARFIEEQRNKRNFDEEEASAISDANLPALVIPAKEDGADNSTYTIDDIMEHNDGVGKTEWFKYGKAVYNKDVMIPIVRERMKLYIENVKVIPSWDTWSEEQTAQVLSFNDGFPIYTARDHGVTRMELRNLLPLCCVGNVVDINRESLIARLKQCVENTLEELNDPDQSEYANDFKDQLNRWLQEYPEVTVYNELQKSRVDPNEQSFPLPKQVLFDPLILRKWIQEWEMFDMELTDDVAWEPMKPMNEDLGDTHAIFAEQVKESHFHESLAELDMAIDGEAGWDVIEIDLFKIDKTTEKQDEIWTLRAKRNNLNDRAWMSKRRGEIADAFIARHEMDPNVVSPFLSFCENLEIAWKQFEELCEKEFIPPKRFAPDTTHVKEHTSETNIKSDDSIGSGKLSVNEPGAEDGIRAIDNDDPSVSNTGDEQLIREQNGQTSGSDVLDDGNTNASKIPLMDNEANAPLVLTEGDGDHEPIILEKTKDTENNRDTMESDRSGDQVDNNLHAVDISPTKTHEDTEKQNNEPDRLVL